MNIVKPNFYMRFQSRKTAVIFKFKAGNRQLTDKKDLVYKILEFFGSVLENLYHKWCDCI